MNSALIWKRRFSLLVGLLCLTVRPVIAQETPSKAGLDGGAYLGVGATLRSLGDADAVITGGVLGRYWLAEFVGVEAALGYAVNLSAAGYGYVTISPGVVFDLAPGKSSTVLAGAGYSAFVNGGSIEGVYFGLGYRPGTGSSHSLTFELRDHVMGLWDQGGTFHQLQFRVTLTL